MKTNSLPALSVATADGTFTARYSARGLAGLDFPTGRSPAAAKAVPAQVRHWHQATCAALNAALAGQPPKTLPPLDLSAGTVFQRRVWNQLRKLKPGQTSSYGELARRVGQAGAARAIGGACGANPIPVLVPCHRVLAANGSLGGFSGGLNWKRLLLEREGR
jgi:O-6-methylguanine DNA methyltransferase